MKEPNELPGKKISKEEGRTKKPSPSAPTIETPVPPQVMDPSTHPPVTERKKPATSPVKQKK